MDLVGLEPPKRSRLTQPLSATTATPRFLTLLATAVWHADPLTPPAHGSGDTCTAVGKNRRGSTCLCGGGVAKACVSRRLRRACFAHRSAPC